MSTHLLTEKIKPGSHRHSGTWLVAEHVPLPQLTRVQASIHRLLATWHTLSPEQSLVFSHSTLVHPNGLLGFPTCFSKHLQNGLWSCTSQLAFGPHCDSSQGFTHFLYPFPSRTHESVAPQSLLVVHSFGLVHPFTYGSPTRPVGQTHLKEPGTLEQEAEGWQIAFSHSLIS